MACTVCDLVLLITLLTAVLFSVVEHIKLANQVSELEQRISEEHCD